MPAASLVESLPVNRTCQPAALLLPLALLFASACSAVPSPAPVPAQHPAPTPAQPPAPAAAREAKAQWSCTVVGVSDGDTVQVLREGKAVKVRLFGVDTPERAQAYGSRAKQFTSDVVFGKTVAVLARDRDRYGRAAADLVLPDGRSFNHELVRAGLAWWYRHYSKDPTLEALEAEARAARRGLWADADPTPPWEFRRGGRGEAEDDRASGGAAAPSAQPTSGPVIGNRRSRVYPRADCPGDGQVSEQTRVRFSGAEEAEAAGYRLAGNCP